MPFKKGNKLGCLTKGKPRPLTTGELNGRWMGESVTYYALHGWIRRIMGRASKCEVCGTLDTKRYEWANIDHKYRRTLEDYIQMCGSCHKKYDHKLRTNKDGRAVQTPARGQ